MEQGSDGIGGERLLPLQWIVEGASSQSELHPGCDVLGRDLEKPWLTQMPADDAWLVLAPHPPTAFNRVEIVNAGSGLLEIHGLREDAEGDGDADYELLLSAQQVMSVKDLISKRNRNQAFNYDIDGNHKLASVTAQQRWRKIRVNCRQPFGTSEHRACIGLAHINFTPCHCKSEPKNRHPEAKPAVKSAKRKLPSWLVSSCESTDAAELLPEKKSKASLANSDRVDIGSVDPVQGRGSSDFEHAGAQAVELVTERFKGRVAGSSETGAEQASRRSFSLKRRSLDGDEIGGSKERKKAQVLVEEEIVQPADQLKDTVVSRVATERKGRDAQVKQPETSSQRKRNLFKEEKGRGESEENQVSKGEVEREFSKLMKGVIFTISGIQNPERGQLRTKGLEMGAQYRPDWSSDCTLLVCVVMGTPKFKQVQANGGSVVSKDWISECHKKRKLVDFERFVLNKGRPWRLPDTTEKEVKRKKVNCGSVEEIQKWAHEDLALTIDWLLQQDAKPEPEELESTAAQGILLCLEDAVRSLAENQQGMSSIIENWGFLPRAVRALAAMEGEDEHAAMTSTSTLLEAERLKGIYDEVLTVFLAPSEKPTTVVDAKKPGGEKEEAEEDDDDATEVMSDVDSQETVDHDSDDTVVLGSEAISECTRKLIGRIR